MLLEAEDKLRELGYVFIGAHGTGSIEWYHKVTDPYLDKYYYNFKEEFEQSNTTQTK